MAVLIPPGSSNPPLSGEPRVYATSADLVTFLGTDTAPDGADRLLARASEWLDGYLMLCQYDTDGLGFPLQAAQRVAACQAACAQVEQWIEVGEDNAISGYPGDTQMFRGRQIMDSKRPGRFAPRAIGILQRAGLVPTVSTQVPWSEKTNWW